jgi:predicted DNA-binding transcriptional regulator AlpA
MKQSTPMDTSDKIIRLPAVCEFLGLSPSTVRRRYTKGAPGYDKRFPKPLPLGPQLGCAIGWRFADLKVYAYAMCW